MKNIENIRIETERTYEVKIGKGLLDHLDEILSEEENFRSGGTKWMLVTDEHVKALYGEKVKESLIRGGFSVEEFCIIPGESSKNLENYGRLQEKLFECHFTRNDVIAALGGGVVGDLAGFAAGTYQRGIRFIQVPTTLLAAVDSSVGGKTAVNLTHGKNQVGCFYQPSLVICDTETLKTLPEEEYLCGCAEIIKYGMLESADFLKQICDQPIREQAEAVIKTCVEMKRKYVLADERDTGFRMLLNFGHTFGHAVEVCSGFSILHGQAVAMGMCAVTQSAVNRGICSAKVQQTLLTACEYYHLPTRIPYSAEKIAEAALQDKKACGEYLNIIVPEQVGKCRIVKIKKEELIAWAEDAIPEE